MNADECIVSKSTVKNVKSCPQNAEEWGNAADKKGCEKVNNSFIYHCVMNTWRNETVEVCALAIRIVGETIPKLFFKIFLSIQLNDVFKILNFVDWLFLKEMFALSTMSGDVGFNAVRKIVVMNVQYLIVPREAIYVSDY